jgi:hypothetical protein
MASYYADTVTDRRGGPGAAPRVSAQSPCGTEVDSLEDPASGLNRQGISLLLAELFARHADIFGISVIRACTAVVRGRLGRRDGVDRWREESAYAGK